jgi:peptide/nickel transport system substrate-binding protein
MKSSYKHLRSWRTGIAVALSLAVLLMSAPGAAVGEPQGVNTPKTGGAINIRLPGTPDCLDVYKTANGFGIQMNLPILDTLLSLNQQGKPIPYVAQKYALAKNGRSIVFDLRPGLKFANGHPVTAADVKSDFERVLDPATKSPFAKSLLGGVTSIETTGKYALRLVLSAPNRPLLTNLGNPALGIMDPSSVAAAGSNTCNGLVGTGPFKFSSVGPAFATVKEVRNPYHTFGPNWDRNKGPAYLSSLTFVPITSNTTAVSELLSGQVDVSDVAGTELSRVQGNKNISLYRVTQQTEINLLFNTARPPFNNVAIRRAVAEAINRKSLITAATQGLGKVSTSFLAPATYDYDPGSTKYAPKLNLDGARAAIAAAHATGPYTLLTTSLAGMDTAAELIQGELAQVGMQVNVVNKSVPDWVAQFQKGTFDMGLLYAGVAEPDILYSFFHSSQLNGGLNFAGVSDATLDKLLLDGRTNLNLKKARSDYFNAQRIIDSKVYVDPLWVPVTVDGVRSRIQDVHTALNGFIQYQDLWIK